MFSIKLIQILPKHYKFLYNLLAERIPSENISHNKLPSYVNHVKFIKSNPYSKWFLIEYGGELIGSVYLSKNNEIAIWIKKYLKDHKNIIRKNILQEILEKFRRRKYFANINPKNKKLVNFYKKNGFKLIYFTFEIKYNKDENVKPNDKNKINLLKKNGYNITQHVYCFLK
jgi:hypothetical protein|tara:strand:+ start:712 stop:1224 length:513 start_codon:yes stop_codon:yes gene_type:complete